MEIEQNHTELQIAKLKLPHRRRKGQPTLRWRLFFSTNILTAAEVWHKIY